MKLNRAFTLIEIIFVVVIIGILSAVIAPKVKRATIQEAADQIASHIRYTQQLALNDNKFNPTDSTWYKKRWQIVFSKSNNSGNFWAYTIFSDQNSDGKPNKTLDIIAKNPLDPKKIMSGGYSGTINYTLSDASKSLTIGKKYDITNITFSNSCSINSSKRLYFDYLGRPMYGAPHSLTKKYFAGSSNRLVMQDCIITITNSAGKSKNIVITPETGYVYIQ